MKSTVEGGSPKLSPVDRPALEVVDLVVRFPLSYGTVAVLDNVTFALQRGEALGIVGESGSGKSLLAKSILGLLPAGGQVAGSIRIGEHQMLDGSRHKRAWGRVVAPVWQDALSSLNPSRRIGGHFDDAARSLRIPRRDAKKNALDALREVSLPRVDRLVEQYPFQLSGGMRQRVLIALALFGQPKVVVADEPTTALDKASEAGVLDLLARLQKERGLTLILISHDVDVVRRVCTRTAVMYAGQLCEMGLTRAVLQHGKHRYTEGLVESVRSLERRARPLYSIPGTVPRPQDFGGGCRFLDRCQHAVDVCHHGRVKSSVSGGEVYCNNPRGADPSGPRQETRCSP